MSELVDLKYTKAEAKAEAAEYSRPMSGPEYPWGLQVRLESEELKKLGITELPTVGKQLQFAAEAEVTSVSQHQTADGKDERCVCLQITKVAIAPAAEGSAPAPAPAPKPAAAGRNTIL